MKETTLLIIAGIFASIYNIMVLVAYALYENVEFENICLVLIIINTIKDTMLFNIILSNIFLG